MTAPPEAEDKPGPEGAVGLEFEPIARPKPKKRTPLRLAVFLIVLLGGGAGFGWVYLGEQFKEEDEFTVPLIRADVAPIKVRPKSPGGMDVPDRDIQVYDRTIGGQSRPLVERLLPKPEAPKSPPVQKPPESAVNKAKAPAAVEKRPPPGPPVPSHADVITVRPPKPAPPPAEPAPKKTTVAAGAKKSAAKPRRAPPPPAPEATPKTGAPPAPPARQAETERLKLPEKTVREKAKAERAPPPAASKVVPKSPGSQVAADAGGGRARPDPRGRYRIQLAAVRTAERAEKEWVLLKARYPDLLRTMTLFVVRADLGPPKGVFYRLRAGPIPTEADAKALCQLLAQRKVSCLVVRPKG